MKIRTAPKAMSASPERGTTTPPGSRRPADDRALVEFLAASEWREGGLIDALPLGLALLDGAGRTLRANRALHDLLGVEPGLLVGRHRQEFLTAPRVRRGHRSFEGEQPLTRPDGQLRWVRVRHLLLDSDVDTVAGELVSVEDLTAERQVHAEVQTSQRLEAMGRLAAGVAHEINTPIQFIGDNVTFLSEAVDSLLGIIDVLVEDLRDVSRNVPRAERVARVEALIEEAELDYYREESPLAVSQAQDGVDRVATIVRAMKALGHPVEREMSPADLDQVLRDTVTVTRGSIKHDAEIELQLGGLPPVRCLASALSQVFLNLIVNAADAIREHRDDGLPGCIRVASTMDGDDVVVTVTDDGGGIPPEVQDRVFEPFFTTKEVGKGTGQGLALARQIVTDQHDGSLTFHTNRGQGTTFTVRLPIAGPATSQPQADR